MKQISMDSLREQPIARLRLSAKNNKVSAKLQYEISEEKWLEQLPSLRSSHPDFQGLLLMDIDAVRQEGNVRKIDCTYESSLEESQMGENKPRKKYSLDVALSEEPVLTHPRYKDLEDDERSALLALIQGRTKDDNGGDLKALVTSDEGLSLMSKIEKGVTTFLAPTIVWREVENAKSLTDFKGVGKIDVPNGDPPELADGRDWMFMGANANETDSGEGWDIERVWQASGPEGFDQDHYKKDVS